MVPWTAVSVCLGVFPFPDDWASVSAALAAGAAKYHSSRGKPAVVVIDGADLIAKTDKTFFSKLQGFAKTCADEGHLRVVFVFSDGVTLPMLQASSAYSRCAPPLEVGDVDDDVAVQYLVDRGLTPEDAVAAVQHVAGGRFYLLTMVAESTEPLDALREALDSMVAKK